MCGDSLADLDTNLLQIIARANKDQDWGINMADCIKIWRGGKLKDSAWSAFTNAAGCIIQSDALSDLLEPVYAAESDLINLLLEPKVAQELASTYSALKEVVKACIDIDAIVPALSATLEYVKAVAAAELPTNFEEAELDAFGAHSYDTKQERAGEVKKGFVSFAPSIRSRLSCCYSSHHTEFRPA
jgi:6-phosphogluconate dehydrogenase